MPITINNRYTGAPIVTLAVATLVGFNFGGLNLTEADFTPYDLTSTVWGGCNSSGSDYRNCVLNGADFRRGNVQGSDFRGMTFNASTIWHQCYLEDVLLSPPYNVVASWFLPWFYGGQSNCVSIATGATTGLPDPAIAYGFETPPSGSSGGAWLPLQIDPVTSDHGMEILLAQLAKAAGIDLGPAKIGKGATTMSDWVPGNPATNFEVITRPALTALVNALQTIRPGAMSRWSAGWWLHEDDARALGLGATTYGQNLLAMLIGLSGIVQQNIWKFFIPVRTQSWLANQVANSFADCRRWEEQYGKAAPGNPTYLDIDAIAHMVDNVHATAAGQDTAGTNYFPLWRALVPLGTP